MDDTSPVPVDGDVLDDDPRSWDLESLISELTQPDFVEQLCGDDPTMKKALTHRLEVLQAELFDLNSSMEVWLRDEPCHSGLQRRCTDAAATRTEASNPDQADPTFKELNSEQRRLLVAVVKLTMVLGIVAAINASQAKQSRKQRPRSVSGKRRGRLDA